MQSELQAVGAVVGGLKTAFDLTKALLDVKGAVEVQGKVFELQRVILAAQSDVFAANQAQAALVNEVSALKAQIAELEAWDREKARYQLTEVSPRVVAYTIKETERGAEPFHMLCAGCFEDRKKGFLQATQELRMRRRVHRCSRCKDEVELVHYNPPTAETGTEESKE